MKTRAFRKRMLTLRNRFVVLFVTFAVLISVLVGWLGWRTARQVLANEIDDKHEKVTRLIAREVRAEDLLDFQPGIERFDVWTTRQRELDERRNSGDVAAAHFFAWKPGDVVAEALVTDRPDILARDPLPWVSAYPAELSQAYELGWASTSRAVGENGQFYKWAIRRLPNREAERPAVAGGAPSAASAGSEAVASVAPAAVPEEAVFLAVRMPANYEESLTTLTRRIVELSLLMSVLAGFAGWKIAGWIVSRLENLSRAALRIQRGWMDEPVPVTGDDEISRLARAMERMRAGIQRRDEQLRLMLSRVAHEIRNPLGGLELFASVAQDTEDPDERREFLEKIRNEVVGLNAIIEEFLGFGHPAQAEPALHDVRQPLADAAALAEAEMAKKGGRLHLEVPPRPLLAVADPGQVKRLVLNLVKNAAAAGRTVWVESAMVNGEVRIVVRDDGPGVAPELQDRIFEPFVSDKEKGAGLGLAIVKEIAESSHGRVELIRPPPDEDGPASDAGSGDDTSLGDDTSPRDEASGGGAGQRGAEFHVYLRGSDTLPVADASSVDEGSGR